MERHTDDSMTTAECRVQCPSCSSVDIATTREELRFPYGSGPAAIELRVEVPVHHCVACKFAFTDETAETRREEAVRRHLQILMPDEIAEVRARYGMSRAKFAAVSRIGTATLARWELGEVVPNAAMDSYLRLLARSDIFALVRSGALYGTFNAETAIVRAASAEPSSSFLALNRSRSLDARRMGASEFNLFA